MLTRAEACALFEALKSIVGERRAKDFWVDVVIDNPRLDPNVGPEADLPTDLEVIGKRHGPPTPRPRSVEPEAPGPSLGMHSGVEGGEA